jgi:hypothetical protein
MAFDRKNLSGNMGAGSGAPKLFTYGTSADAKAAIIASGYFNDATDVLSKGDIILAYGTDATVALTVTSATGAATVTTGYVAVA